jgi:hypothetical protein
MRKVLLATTALVALGGVSVANAADIAISGNIEFEYNDVQDSAATMKTDGVVTITASTTADSGMAFETGFSHKMESAAVDAAYLSVSSADMGTVYFGNIDDNAIGLLDGALGKNNDIESENATASTSIDSDSGVMINYISPKIGGLQIGAYTQAGDESGYALTYSLAGVSIYYGAQDDYSNLGVKTSMAGFTIAVGSMDKSGAKDKANDVAVKYTLGNGITVAALSANATTSTGAKQKYQNFGAKYSIADGVYVAAETGKTDSKNYTWLSVGMSF